MDILIDRYDTVIISPDFYKDKFFKVNFYFNDEVVYSLYSSYFAMSFGTVPYTFYKDEFALSDAILCSHYEWTTYNNTLPFKVFDSPRILYSHGRSRDLYSVTYTVGSRGFYYLFNSVSFFVESCCELDFNPILERL